MTRIYAIGPSNFRDDKKLSWARVEMIRAMNRLKQRYHDVTALVSLTPGVGPIWYEAAKAADAQVESWVVHPEHQRYWRAGHRSGLYDEIIRESAGLCVSFTDGQLAASMYYHHVRKIAESADITVLVWDGDPEDYGAEIVREVADSIYLIDYRRMKVEWMPDGYAVSAG